MWRRLLPYVQDMPPELPGSNQQVYLLKNKIKPDPRELEFDAANVVWLDLSDQISALKAMKASLGIDTPEAASTPRQRSWPTPAHVLYG